MSPRRKTKRKGKGYSPAQGLIPAVRMKGGVLFDPQVNGFIVIVHQWDNPDCRGEPEEWRYPEVFPTEDAAMQYYKTSIRPALKHMMADTAGRLPGSAFIHRELEK
jgi:hypothetical protein